MGMSVLSHKTIALRDMEANICAFSDRVLLTLATAGLQNNIHLSASDAFALSAALSRAAGAVVLAGAPEQAGVAP